MTFLYPKQYLSEKEFKKVVATALTYIITLSPEKIRAVLYFFYYTGITRQSLLKITRKEIEKSKRQRKMFLSRTLQKILKKYYATEPEQTNAFNISDKNLRTFLANLNKYSNLPIGVNILKKSYLINERRKNGSI